MATADELLKLDEANVSTVALASAVTGFLLCDIGEVYHVIEQMTGVAPYTHQLPRMGRELAVHVKELVPDFPDKREAAAFPVNAETVHDFAAAIVKRFGETITLPRQTVQARDPLSELVDMVGPERVVVVAPSTLDGKSDGEQHG